MSRKQSFKPAVTALEDRCLPSVTIHEFAGLTAASTPQAIAAGADGNLWFTELTANQIGRITPGGAVTEFAVPASHSGLQDITAGPDGNLWFTEITADQIGRITPQGTIVEFAVPTSMSGPFAITLGPDNNLWFSVPAANRIGRITPAGSITLFPAASISTDGPTYITSGPDGNLWFTEDNSNNVARITPQGVVTEFDLAAGRPLMFNFHDITTGPDGNLWLTTTEIGKLPPKTRTGVIGRLTTTGSLTEFPLSPSTTPFGIATGPDGNLWFVEDSANQVGQITPAGVVTEFSIPTSFSGPQDITAGSDGNLWFTERAANQIGQVVIDHPIVLTPSQRYVTRVYRDLLRRAPDASGLSAWSAVLDLGVSRLAVVSAIESSPEYRKVQVQEVYQVLLHRTADPQGLGAGAAFLAAGGTVEQLEAFVAASPEYFQVRGGGSFDGFLDALYQDALGRPIDAQSRSILDQAATSGMSRDAVAGFVFSSLEYQAHLVSGLYMMLLKRPADPGGLQNAVAALQLGLRDEQLTALLAASNEYYALSLVISH